MRATRHWLGATHTDLLVLLAAACLMVGLTASDGWAARKARPGRLVVTVQESNGRFAANVAVVIKHMKKQGGVVQHDGQTNERGAVIFDKLEQAHWTITATKDGKTGQTAADTKLGQTATASVKLTAASTTSSNSATRTGNLIVTVQGSDGTGAANAVVVITQRSKTRGNLRHSGKTDQLGKMTFNKINTGHWAITVTEPGKSGRGSVDLKAGDTARATIVMSAGSMK